MTVAELIIELSKYRHDLEVRISVIDLPVTLIELQIDNDTDEEFVDIV